MHASECLLFNHVTLTVVASIPGHINIYHSLKPCDDINIDCDSSTLTFAIKM